MLKKEKFIRNERNRYTKIYSKKNRGIIYV